MANRVCEVLLTEAKLGATAGAVTLTTDVDLESGAIVEFCGVVRESEDGQQIEGIHYEAHGKMAEHQLQIVGREAAAKFELHRAVIHHRIGFVPAGESSLFLHVRASHRAAAFDASKWIVDELKKKVPIWKRSRFKDRPAFVEATAWQT